MDFLLGAEASEETTSSWDEWVQQHLEQLQVARNVAGKNLEEAAEYRQQHHNQQACDSGFREGQLVYLKDHRCQGRRKIQDVWSPVLYQVVEAPTEPGGPYTITLADGTGTVRRVHRTEMRSAQLETLPSAPVVPKPCPPSSHLDSDPDSSGDEGALAWIGKEIPPQLADETLQNIQQFIPSRAENTPGVNFEALENESTTHHVGQEMPSPQGETSAPRRTTRVTAGKNSNPYNLPRSTVANDNMVVRTAASLEPGVIRNPQFKYILFICFSSGLT